MKFKIFRNTLPNKTEIKLMKFLRLRKIKIFKVGWIGCMEEKEVEEKKRL